MSGRVIAVLVALVLIIAVAGALWAEYASEKRAAKASCEGESDRCTMTCTMLMNHYNKKFATMKAHEGDKQCWQTCWSRMGRGETGTVAETKALWMKNMAPNMRVNQCAQACWRSHHEDSNTVEVGGWRSAPRTVVCTP